MSINAGKRTIRAFLFDLDGVLWDSNEVHAAAMAETCQWAGLRMVDYGRLAGLSTPAAFKLILEENGNPDGALVAELSERKRSLFQQRIDEVASDHDALLDALSKRRPQYLALVTGASQETAAAYLRRLPTDFFDLVITSADGLPSKPHPDVYLAATNRLGVAPHEAVVFEDSEAGLASARAAGIPVAHITFAWAGHTNDSPCPANWCAETVVDAMNTVWSDS